MSESKVTVFHPELGEIEVNQGELSNDVRFALTTGLCGSLALEYLSKFSGEPFFIYPLDPDRADNWSLAEDFNEEPEWIFSALHVVVKVSNDCYLDANGIHSESSLLGCPLYSGHGLVSGNEEILSHYAGLNRYDLSSFVETMNSMFKNGVNLGEPVSSE